MGAHSVSATDVEPGAHRRKRNRIVAASLIAGAAVAIAVTLAAYFGGAYAARSAAKPLSEVVPGVSVDAERIAVAEWGPASEGGGVVDLTDDAAALMSFTALFNDEGEVVARTGTCDIPPDFGADTAYMIRVKPGDPKRRTVTLAAYRDGRLWISAGHYSTGQGGGVDPMGAMYAVDDDGALYSYCEGLFPTEGGE